MPLIKSKSKKAIGKNIETEMHEGKAAKTGCGDSFEYRSEGWSPYT